nr:type II toxin-antitoxin system RelE/ParE family toxin [Paenibacillus lemnae]
MFTSQRPLKKIEYCIARLQIEGTKVGEPITKHITGKIWELRPDDHRILFFAHIGNTFDLLHIQERGKFNERVE